MRIMSTYARITPIVHGLQHRPPVDARPGMSGARRHNLLWHGLPTLLATLLAGGGVAVAITHEAPAPRCGFAIAEKGDSPSTLVDALGRSAGISTVHNPYDTQAAIKRILPVPHENDALTVTFTGSSADTDTLRAVDPSQNPCATPTPSPAIPQS